MAAEGELVREYFSHCMDIVISEGNYLSLKKLSQDMGVETFMKVLEERDDHGKTLLSLVQEKLSDAKRVYDIVYETNDKREILQASGRYNGLLFMEHVINISAKKMAQAATQA